MLTAVIDDGQQQIELFKRPLLGIKTPARIENINQAFHVSNLSRPFQLVWRRRGIPQPDQLRRCAAEALIELVQTAIAAEGHDCGELALNSQDVAAVLSRNTPSNGCERREVIELSLNVPHLWSTQGPELLERNRLQSLNHLPFGSNGSLEPPDVADTVTVFWAICWSRIFCRLSGNSSLVRMKVWSAWNTLAISM